MERGAGVPVSIAEGRDRSSGRSGTWVANGLVNAWAVQLSNSLFIHISRTGPLGETVPAIFKTGSYGVSLILARRKAFGAVGTVSGARKVR